MLYYKHEDGNISFECIIRKSRRNGLLYGNSPLRLFAIALEEFIIRHNGNMITEKINEVYEKIDRTEFEPNLNVILESQKDVTKNDMW